VTERERERERESGGYRWKEMGLASLGGREMETARIGSAVF